MTSAARGVARNRLKMSVRRVGFLAAEKVILGLGGWGLF
jgi:hypothetical protein